MHPWTVSVMLIVQEIREMLTKCELLQSGTPNQALMVYN